MGYIQTYQCDECKTLKYKSNGWYILGVRDEARQIVIEPLDNKKSAQPLGPDEIVLCSKQCLMLWVERSLERIRSEDNHG